MAQSFVSNEQRFRKFGLRCPICGGHSGEKPGKGTRCAGYELEDGEYVFCTREEYAGHLEPKENTTPRSFCHKMYGPCNCGKEHNPARATNSHKPHTPNKDGQPRIVAEYAYQDASGRLAYQSLRYEPKNFKQRRPDGKGGWEWNMQEVTYVPYRLPDLLRNRDSAVYIVEGEKDADNLAHIGLVATTNVGGAGKWRKEYNQYLKGRKVIILPDNDDPGREHADLAAQSLRNIAASVKIIELPDLPEKGDVSDWLAAGGTREKLERMSKPPLPETRSFHDLMTKELPPIRWIVPEMLAEGLTILAGKQKLGKSWLLLALGLAVSAGEKFLGNINVARCDVLYLALEDNERRLQDRMKQLLPPGASVPAGFHYATRWPRLDAEGLQLLSTWLDEHPSVRMVIIDTWGRAKPLSRMRNGYDADIDAASGIQTLAMERNISILATCHLRKAEAADALDELNATTGLSATADNILILKRERGKADASLFGTGREIELDKALAFDNGAWKLLGDGAEYRLSQEQKEVIEAINQAEKAIGAKEIAAFIRDTGKQVSDGAIRYRLFDMKQKGLIKELDKGKYTVLPNMPNATNAPNMPNVPNAEHEPPRVREEEQTLGTLGNVRIEKTPVEQPVKNDNSNSVRHVRHVSQNDSLLPFPAQPLYNNGPKDALEAARYLKQWVNSPVGFGQIIYTNEYRVDIDVMGQIKSLRGAQIPQIEVKIDG